MACAAAANDRSSATLANIAIPSKSGNFDIDNSATMDFHHFYFENAASATDLLQPALSEAETRFKETFNERDPLSSLRRPTADRPALRHERPWQTRRLWRHHRDDR